MTKRQRKILQAIAWMPAFTFGNAPATASYSNRGRVTASRWYNTANGITDYRAGDAALSRHTECRGGARKASGQLDEFWGGGRSPSTAPRS